MPLLNLLLLLAYAPSLWQFYPRMDDIRCLSAGTRDLYVTVPAGVYILDRTSLEHERTICRPDGLRGEARLAAWNSSRNELLIVTREGAVDRLWSWNPFLDRLNELDPPFEEIRSLGTNDAGAWFDTEQGLFLKERLLDRYEPQNGFPPDIQWYGERFPHAVRDFPVLTPYFVTDDDLVQHDLTLAYPDPRSSRLFVAARGHGLTVWNSRSGFIERHVRLGPPAGTVERILAADGRLWFLAGDRAAALLPDSGWTHRRAGSAARPAFELRLLSPALVELDRREGVTALVQDSDRLWAAAGDAIYELAPVGRPRLLARLPGAVNALVRLEQSLLAGTEYGLFAWTPDTLVLIDDPFGRTAFGVHSLARGADGTLWVGARGSILRFGGDDDWEQLIPPGFPLDREVSALASAGDIVFHDNGDGVTAWDTSDSTWVTIGPDQGLDIGPLTALWADADHLWLAAPGMLARLAYRSLLPVD